MIEMELHNDITISDLEIMMHAKNYRRWIINTVKPHIGNRILEVGGGIGNNVEYLLDRELIVIIDNHQKCEKYILRRFNNSNILFFNMDITNNSAVAQLAKFNFDTILCLNVLEHIENDVVGLQNIKDVLAVNGKLILIVPAFNSLYGSIDKAVGHKRRYTKNLLVKKINSLHMEIESLRFMNFLGIFGWFLNNKILRRKKESLPQIVFYDKYLAPFAEKLEKILPPPIGLSIVGVFRKK
ncbi:MAG: class I SAM-dependent methyltransferase [Candidatus Brocadia sp.]|nr:class I SAM-dependent methyltransferase [Candidatus Brocadia sp.]